MARLGALGIIGLGAYRVWQWYNEPVEQPKQMPTDITGRTEEHLREEALRKYNINTIHHYNIALCGMSGVGKSSLINALRGIRSNHPLAAKVSSGVEGPDFVMKYPHPQRPKTYYWDIPGTGTLLHPSENYFIDKCLYAFDLLLIVGCSRFTAVEFRLLNEATKYKVPVAFVRNKSDQDIFNEMRNRNVIHNNRIGVDQIKTELKWKILESFRKNLRAAKFHEKEAHLFIVNAHSFRAETVDDELYSMEEDKLVEYMCNTVKTNRWHTP